MARIRTIKPEFPQSESMGNVSRDARLCFIMLWTLADDEGKLRGNSRMLASLLFPYDDDAKKLINGWLAELSREGCITQYEVDGASYVEIAKWLEHQKIDRPSQSKIPSFDEASRTLANDREPSSGDLRIKDQGSKDQGPKDQGTRDAVKFSVSEFDQFWNAYPRKISKGAALKAWKAAIKKTSPESLMAAVTAHGEHWRTEKTESEFIPHPATWLNGERWSDDLSKPEKVETWRQYCPDPDEVPEHAS